MGDDKTPVWTDTPDAEDPDSSTVVPDNDDVPNKKQVTDDPGDEGEQEQKQDKKPDPEKDLEPQKIKFTEEQQARFNSVWKEAKETQKALKQSAEMNRKLLERIDELEDKVDTGQTQSTIDTLTAQRAAAVEEGDTLKAIELTEKIVEERVKSKTAKPKKETKPDPDKKPDVEVDDDDPIAPEYYEAYGTWATEVDDKGNFTRPWALQGHPMHNTAMGIAEGVLERLGENRPPQEYLEAVDKGMATHLAKMGMGKRRGPTVLTDTGDSPGGSGKKERRSRLSPEERRVAQMMFPNAEDPLKAYRDAKEDAGME